ncbi:MAG: FeoB small GTPase domain-containing protein, partial [Desulfurobacteriaceae bacterium]
MKRKIKVALVGNPNVGKTAILNTLCGTSEKVGNWPGVTVEKKMGNYTFRGFEIDVIDLPGIYSLTSYTLEEKVARGFLLKEDYDVVINVLDVNFLGRNLYLTLELLEMGIKPIVVLNKIDDLESAGFSIDEKLLSQILGLPVISISAIKKRGFEELSETVLRVATKDLKPVGFTPTYSEDLENAISLLLLKLKDEKLSYNKRWFSIKLLEKDPEIVEEAKRLLSSKVEILKEIENIENFVKEKHQCDLPSFVAKERFILASKIARKVIKTVNEVHSETLSDKLDKIL